MIGSFVHSHQWQSGIVGGGAALPWMTRSANCEAVVKLKHEACFQTHVMTGGLFSCFSPNGRRACM